MKKKSKWLITVCCIIVAVSAMVGCKKGTETPTVPPVAVELNLIRDSVELELFEEYAMQYTYTGSEAITWSVDDSSIVTVANGKLVAQSAGETIVRIQAGSLNDSCNVKVKDVNVDLLSVDVEQAQVALYVGQTHTLNPTVSYGNKVLNVSNFEFASADQNVISVSTSGTLTANAVGETSVSVTTTALDRAVGCVVNVVVSSSGQISLDKLQLTLYPYEEYQGVTYENQVQLNVTIKEKGIDKSNAIISWSTSDQNVATVQNGIVKAVSVGTVEITATYVGEDGNVVSDVCFVQVVPVTHTQSTTYDVIKSRSFTLENVQAQVLSTHVTDGVLQIEVPISGTTLDFSDIAFVGNATLVVNTGNVLTEMPIYLWTDGISTIDGLLSIRNLENGHYRLEKDLDLSSVSWSYETETIFKGVFDGAGHSLKNFAPNSSGLFNGIGDGATIQNLKFENAIITSNNTSIGCIAGFVTENAKVKIENVTGNVINSGNACGGLFGRIAKNSEVYVDNCNLHVYANDSQTSGGAIVGCADSVILMSDTANSIFYTNINLCGSLAYEGFSNSARAAINEYSSVKPTEYQAVADVYDILAGNKIITLGDNSVVKATLFAKQVGEVSYNNGSFIIPKTLVQNFVGDTLEVMLEKSNGTKSYHSIKVQYGELRLNNENKEILKYAYGGLIVLEEDVDLSHEKWTTIASFNGIIDGNGYAIKNLATSDNDGNYYGLFKNIQGEIKNIAFIGVRLGKNSGVLAGRATGNLSLTNVFIQVDKTVSGGRASATVERSTIAGVTINMKDVVIAMPKNISKEYIFGYQIRGLSKLENVYCIGLGNTAYSETGSNYVDLNNSTTTFFTDKISFNLALKEENNNITLTDTNKAFINEYYSINILMVGQSNVNSLLSLSGDEYVYLTEDIDLKDITWNGNVKFTGTFEGNNHVISNLKVETSNGFFKDVSGAIIKNVAFANVDLGTGAGVITYQPTGSFRVENVFIQVTKTSSGARLGAICERSGVADVAITLKDVVISMPNTNANEAIFGYQIRGTSLLTNVHCIGLPNETASVGNAQANLSSSSTYTLHTSLTAFNDASKTLTTFLESCVAKYLNGTN